MAEITELLKAASDGSPASEAALLEAVYAELHKLAASFMRRERQDHTLQPTALVNEAYVRLVGDHPLSFESRGHFFVSAAQTMRRILVERARHKGRIRHGGGFLVSDAVEKSIAVLPFDNFSDEKENAFFADGIQDDILTSLARIHDLKVISRTSVMPYRGKGKSNLREIAHALGVVNVLEGSVRRGENRVVDPLLPAPGSADRKIE